MKTSSQKEPAAERVPSLAPLPSGPGPSGQVPATSRGAAFRGLFSAAIAVLLAFAIAGILILVSGKNPFVAYWALLRGAFGSTDSVTFALNKSTPYILAGVGVAICFRARVINIGSEGQIAVGGVAASWIALNVPDLPSAVVVPLATIGGALAGAAWASIAALMRLKRGVHEVLGTLLSNFVGVLLVSEVLHGSMGEPGAGFPQSPLFPQGAWLQPLFEGSDLHAGILLAVLAVVACHLLLWHTPLGFRIRLLGSSDRAAAYAGVSVARTVLSVMLLAGALSGIAGAVEVLGVHFRLIQGFSQGFGFNAVAVALLAALNPVAVLPAGLFFGFLEAGALAMQREVGVQSSLVYVIQGLTMVFVLCALAINSKQQRV
ncbi:MAG: ABC transporter permease [Verrucomicrobia bacterium]|nr:ABC transporter permease [Verrucomicrobiota bacterium]